MLLSVKKYFDFQKEKIHSQEKGTRAVCSEELTPALVKLTSRRSK